MDNDLTYIIIYFGNFSWVIENWILKDMTSSSSSLKLLDIIFIYLIKRIIPMT